MKSSHRVHGRRRKAGGLCMGSNALRRLAGTLLVASASMAVAASAADGFPAKPVRLIVAQSVGTSVDTLGRIIGTQLGEQWGKQVIIDNRGGAGGTIGAEIASRAAPDGYTLLMSSTAMQVISPQIYKNLTYHPLKDFMPLAMLAITQNMLVANASLPFKGVKDMIAYAKANPGKLAHGSPGIGSTGHLSAELFKSMTGTTMTHVAYKGSAPTLQDLMSGQLQVVIDNIPVYLPQVKAGKIRALAVTTAKRSPAAPELPTVDEAGVKGYEASTWFALFAPAGTPAPAVAKLSAETRRILSMPDVRDRLLGLGAQPAGSTPEELAAFVRSENSKWEKVIRSANVTLN